jgi:hypothetical protein
MKSRILSGVIAAGYVVLAYLTSDGETTFKVGMVLILPLACIWFSEEMGSFTGVMRGHAVTSESPGCLVAFCGWVLLLLPVIIGLVTYFSGSK